MTDCPTCARLRADNRDARVRLLHAMDDDEATLRAFEDHERAAHPIRAPRRWWTPANYDGEPWPSGVVSSTFDPATLEDGAG